MRVVEVTEFGSPDVLQIGERTDPRAGPDQLIVDVEFAEILYLDTQLRSGWGGEYFDLETPYVPGGGVSGRVTALGDGVDPVWLGQRVVGSTALAGEYAGGGYAERAVIPVAGSYLIPDDVGSDVALSAVSDGYMGVSRMAMAVPGPDDVVLVTAASGGIGVWLIPLARAAGATVVGAAHGPEKTAAVMALGANAAIDYRDPAWTQKVIEAVDGRAVTIVFDGTAGDSGIAALALLGDHGQFISYGSAGGFSDQDISAATDRGIRYTGLMDAQPRPGDQTRDTLRALELLASGAVHPLIGQTVPLEQAGAAHAAIEGRRISGKSLLRI